MAAAPTISRVAVIGGGLMGSGIAESTAVAGLAVVVHELEERRDASRIRLARSLERAVGGGKLDPAERDAALGRVEFTNTLDDVAGADLVIEAVPEDEALKLELIGAIGRVVDDHALVASNTSSIPIAKLAGALRRPERVLGLHFFSPVPVMRLVEVVRALDTSEEAVRRGRSWSAWASSRSRPRTGRASSSTSC